MPIIGAWRLGEPQCCPKLCLHQGCLIAARLKRPHCAILAAELRQKKFAGANGKGHRSGSPHLPCHREERRKHRTTQRSLLRAMLYERQSEPPHSFLGKLHFSNRIPFAGTVYATDAENAGQAICGKWQSAAGRCNSNDYEKFVQLPIAQNSGQAATAIHALRRMPAERENRQQQRKSNAADHEAHHRYHQRLD
jgi:hypothetical protein